MHLQSPLEHTELQLGQEGSENPKCEMIQKYSCANATVSKGISWHPHARVHTLQKWVHPLAGFLHLLSIQEFSIHLKIFSLPLLEVLEDGVGREELR